MAWWGKLVGAAFGFMLGGPLGALLGGALGHGLDRSIRRSGGIDRLDSGVRERVQTTFFTATFSVMGRMAKVDGRVSEQEIALAESVIARLELSRDMRRAAIRLFREGKTEQFPLNEMLDRLRHACHRHRTLMQMFLEIQIQAAYADGRPGPDQERLLRHICKRLKIPEQILRHLEQVERLQQGYGTHTRRNDERAPPRRPAASPNLDRAYTVLGVEPKATDAEIERAYRRLLSRHHPDKLVSKGLPEEMMKLAAEKTHEIRQAYKAITRARTS